MVSKVVGERGEKYGHPVDNHGCTGALFSLWIKRWSEAQKSQDESQTLTGIDVCVFNIMQKLSRAAESPELRDHWEDIMGYAENVLMILEKEYGDE